MKLGLFSIFDSASGVYDGPFKARTDAEAIRAFSGVVADAEHPVGRHPEDFTLVKVGSWNDGTGEVEDKGNLSLCTGLEMVAQLRNVDTEKLAQFNTSVGNGDDSHAT
jgi:hypothetical protein